GFLANGIAFKVGESEVSGAFDSVKHASSLADAAQEFKDSLAAMRISARDFVTRPGADQIQSFEDSHQRALSSLDAIERRLPVSERRDIEGLGARLATVKNNFDALTKAQEKLGFTDDDGLRRAMRDTAIGIERIIHEDMSWLREIDSQRLMVSLV